MTSWYFGSGPCDTKHVCGLLRCHFPHFVAAELHAILVCWAKSTTSAFQGSGRGSQTAKSLSALSFSRLLSRLSGVRSPPGRPIPYFMQLHAASELALLTGVAGFSLCLAMSVRSMESSQVVGTCRYFHRHLRVA